jgi:hypothetical protein
MKKTEKFMQILSQIFVELVKFIVQKTRQKNTPLLN